MDRATPRGGLWLICLVGYLHPLAALAHPLPFISSKGTVLPADVKHTEAQVVFKSDGTYQVDLTLDLDAVAIGLPDYDNPADLATWLRAMPPSEFEAAVERTRETIQKRLSLRFDGLKQTLSVVFPELGASGQDRAEPEPVLGKLARITGSVPEGAEVFTLRASRPVAPVYLEILDQAAATGATFTLDVAEENPPFQLGGSARPVTRLAVLERYLVLGFEHILPLGVDHVLFVLALFLLSTKLRPLVWQLTAFTIAHSVTLGLSMADVVSLSPRVVESLIALSIACVAVENVLTTELKPWRSAVVFGFGLLHGLGFAGALRELGLPEGEFLPALLMFNLGVEFGQLSVVMLALLAIGWFRRKAWYRRAIVLPLSGAIGLVGLYWTIQRSVVGL